jgi:hypothetical protein
MKGIMTVLLHTVEYDTNGVWIDEDAEDILHDIVCDRISCDKKTEGAEILELEDNEENRLPVDVSWKIINPEAEEWKQLAESIHSILQNTWGAGHPEIDKWVTNYEELIKQTTNE